MNKDTLFLIDKLAEEQERLSELIESSVKTGEYLIAHFHSEALDRVNRQLQVIRNLDDQAYDKKMTLLRLIRANEKMLAMDYPEGIKQYLSDQLNKDKQELKELNRSEKVRSEESKTLGKYLTLFVKKKINGIRLVLHKENDLALALKNENDQIILSIPMIRKLMKQNLINDDTAQNLSSLGFIVQDDNQFSLSMRREGDVIYKINLLISKMVFEVFYFEEFRSQSFIEIME